MHRGQKASALTPTHQKMIEQLPATHAKAHEDLVALRRELESLKRHRIVRLFRRLMH